MDSIPITKDGTMEDLIFIAAGIAFYVATIALAHLFERLRSSR
jgi:hypothetical protein